MLITIKDALKDKKLSRLLESLEKEEFYLNKEKINFKDKYIKLVEFFKDDYTFDTMEDYYLIFMVLLFHVVRGTLEKKENMNVKTIVLVDDKDEEIKQVINFSEDGLITSIDFVEDDEIVETLEAEETRLIYVV